MAAWGVMKNQYWGDVNDYVKYGLLRVLLASGLRLGVCWMLTTDDERTDGNKLAYLAHPERWRPYDPPLYDALQGAVAGRKERDVALTRRLNLLPGALYGDRLLTDDRPQRTGAMAAMLRDLASADWVFFDPDNGLEVRSAPLGRRGSRRYVYGAELEATWRGGQSVLIYQHWRRVAHPVMQAQVVAQVRRHTPGSQLHLFTTAHVLFVLATQAEHHALASAASQVPGAWPRQIDYHEAAQIPEPSVS
jgi:integrase